ncbi:MAG: hypothetical protein JWN56_1064 [Sphingobacteriales bacterium]|nr:hypothetical protein [Sphingobacteriales bacterium]
MGNYKDQLAMNLAVTGFYNEVAQDSYGDIWITLRPLEDIDSIYDSFFHVLGQLPDINYPAERVKIYFNKKPDLKRGKVYCHLINPTKGDFANPANSV